MQCVYYRPPRGREPVDAFIDELPPDHQAVVDMQIDRLNGLPPKAPPLAFPHSSQVDGELRELRCHYGRTLYRVLYCRSGNLLVLLHAIEKRSQKIPARDVEVAKARWEDFKSRMDANPRRPPREPQVAMPRKRASQYC